MTANHGSQPWHAFSQAFIKNQIIKKVYAKKSEYKKYEQTLATQTWITYWEVAKG